MENNNYDTLFDKLQENPELMSSLLAAKQEGPVRAGGEDPTSQILKQLLGTGATAEDVSKAAETIDANALMQLYLGAGGDIDAKELLDYTGGFKGTNPNNSDSVRALMNGKLEFKELLILIALFKLMTGGKKPAANSYSNTGGLLGSMLGGNTQQNSALNLFNSMLTGQTAQPASSGLFGNLFTSAAPQQASPNVFSFGSSNNSAANSVLQSLLTGTSTNATGQLLSSLLGANSHNAYNSNGTINVGTLFNVANALLNAKK
ncbi:MAG: hypothetical protein K6F23_13450 [Solobacterium sp.]|nr:hypothetical protein [Solobacterium sp.]MCR5450385.1 hypothetical protein [Solobacterium sp.]